MERLSYDVLAQAGYDGYILKDAPEKVLQFGDGNFLRAFTDYFFDVANEKAGWNGKIVLVQPNSPDPARADSFNVQDGLYTLYLRGLVDGQKVDERRVMSVVSRCLNARRDFAEILKVGISDDLEYIVSNTTEAGIVYDSGAKFEDMPPASFPAKLTRVLYERFRAGKKGLIILSCELIDHNGDELLRCVKLHADDWNLGDDFSRWLTEENMFCNTLVDRLVTGAIRDPKELMEAETANGYEDAHLVVGEPFAFWAIEGPQELENVLPFKAAGLEDMVMVTDDVMPYKKRKVRILNASHTCVVLSAYLAGFNIVRQYMNDEVYRAFHRKLVYEEVIPVLPLDREDLVNFGRAVEERYANPFTDHQLLAISLNSTSKYVSRNLPSLQDYCKTFGRLPECMTMGLAAYIAFYGCFVTGRDGEGLHCVRPDGTAYTVHDDGWVQDFYYEHREDSPQELVRAVLANGAMWGSDLTAVEGLEERVCTCLEMILKDGAKAAYASCL